jgi:hypothetical protein
MATVKRKQRPPADRPKDTGPNFVWVSLRGDEAAPGDVRIGGLRILRAPDGTPFGVIEPGTGR